LKKRIVGGVQRHESKLEVIVGKGLHSKGGVAKLKPAVEEMCEEAGFRSYIDPKNTGVLVIELTNARIPQAWTNITPLTAGGNYQQPQHAYQPQQQPQYQQQGYNNYNQGHNQGYQQQQQHHQHHNNNNNNNNNNGLAIKIAKFALKLFCQFVNK